MSNNDDRFDEDGFLRDPADWSVQLAEEIARREGIAALGEDHRKVIEALRSHYLANGTVPVMRRVCHEAGLQEHCIHDLLKDPRRAWRIAGLPNPGEEAKAYLEASEIGD